MEAIATQRIRLNFEDANILTKTQKKLGLKRSWLLLKPHYNTISDVVADILDAFDLHQSCPHGILLSMDGFVLPPFESTIILKDKDQVSVKRKELGVKAITEARPSIEDETVEKEPIPSGLMLLPNNKFDKGARGYESESDADEVEAEEPMQSSGVRDGLSKKRKASSPIKLLKKKRQRQVSPKSLQKKDIDHCDNITSPQRKRKTASSNKNDVTIKSTNNSELRSESKELDEEKEVTLPASGVPSGAIKVPRSSRRKRRQNQWKKVGRINNNEEDEKKHTIKNIIANIEELLAEEDSDADDAIVSVEIRPGHIRFASASKAKLLQKCQEAGWNGKQNQENDWVQKSQEANDWDVESTQKSVGGDHLAQKNVCHSNKNKAAKETFCWNGITNKRKGQKWGKENQLSSLKQNDHQTQRRKRPYDFFKDFKKFMPLVESPKVGDVVAYRLLELSSTYRPALSTYRVGKVASYDQETNNIMLIPEPGYPFKFKKKANNDHDDDDSGKPQSYGYNEDGSLEIDFRSLVDVRRVKTAIPGYSGVGQYPVNRTRDLWEELSEALATKKAQFVQEDLWKKKVSSSKRSWSQRTLRSGALGPNMAVLRPQNGV